MNSRYNKYWLLFSNDFISIITTSNHKNLNFSFIEYTWIHNLNVILHSYSSKSDYWWDLVCVCVVNTLNRTTHSSGPRECTAYRSVFQFIVQARNQVVRNATLHSVLGISYTFWNPRLLGSLSEVHKRRCYGNLWGVYVGTGATAVKDGLTNTIQPNSGRERRGWLRSMLLFL